MKELVETRREKQQGKDNGGGECKRRRERKTQRESAYPDHRIVGLSTNHMFTLTSVTER